MVKVLIIDSDYRFLTHLEDHFKNVDDIELEIKYIMPLDVLQSYVSENKFNIIIVGNMNDSNFEFSLWLMGHKSNSLLLKIFDPATESNPIRLLQYGFTSLWVKSDDFVHLQEVIHFTARRGAYIDPNLSNDIINFLQPKLKEWMMQISNLKSMNKKVLHLLKLGYSYSEISTELGISIDKVRYNIKIIYKTLNVKNRVEAITKHNYFDEDL